jgi:hypothetical protein
MVGDGYDNALAETTIGLFITEKINRNRAWKTVADVELATLEWVDWYNNPTNSGRFSVSRTECPGVLQNRRGPLRRRRGYGWRNA